MNEKQLLLQMAVPTYKSVYLLGSFDRRVTIKTQQDRAVNIIHSLNKTRLLSHDSSLLIIGAGIAGLTAAAYAKRLLDCKITVLEKKPAILPIVNGGTDRWLHPNVFDWPKPGWDIEDAQLPVLSWSQGKAFETVDELKQQWTEVVNEGKIEIHFNVSDTKIKQSGKQLSVTWNSTGQCLDTFDAVILAVGFGIERNLQPPDFMSYWRKDNLDNISLENSDPIKVLISGCGDGGLIDALRATIANFKHIEVINQFLPNSDSEIKEAQKSLLEIEEGANSNGAIWLHQRYREIKTPNLNKKLQPLIRSDTKVWLNGPEMTPITNRSTILNRFLVSRLQQLNAINYLCGKLNVPELQRRATQTTTYKALIDSEENVFDKVVLRHGPESALKKGFPEIWKASQERLTAYSMLDFTRKRLWETKAEDAPSNKSNQVEIEEGVNSRTSSYFVLKEPESREEYQTQRNRVLDLLKEQAEKFVPVSAGTKGNTYNLLEDTLRDGNNFQLSIHEFREISLDSTGSYDWREKVLLIDIILLRLVKDWSNEIFFELLNIDDPSNEEITLELILCFFVLLGRNNIKEQIQRNTKAKARLSDILSKNLEVVKQTFFALIDNTERESQIFRFGSSGNLKAAPISYLNKFSKLEIPNFPEDDQAKFVMSFLAKNPLYTDYEKRVFVNSYSSWSGGLRHIIFQKLATQSLDWHLERTNRTHMRQFQRIISILQFADTCSLPGLKDAIRNILAIADGTEGFVAWKWLPAYLKNKAYASLAQLSENATNTKEMLSSSINCIEIAIKEGSKEKDLLFDWAIHLLELSRLKKSETEKEAIALLLQADIKFSEAREDSKEKYKFWRQWADCLLELSNLYKTHSKDKEEIDCRRFAEEKYLEALKLNEATPSSWHNRALNIFEIATYEIDNGKSEGGKKCLEHASAYYQKAINLQSIQPHSWYGWGLTISHLAVLNSSNEKQLLTEAVEKFSNADRFRKGMKIDGLQYNWGATLAKLATLADSEKEKVQLLTKAVALFEKSIEAGQKIQETIQNSVATRIHLYHSIRKEDATKAEEYFRESTEWLSKTTEKTGETIESTYNYACFQAILGNKEAALESLIASLKSKSVTPAVVRKDDDWQEFYNDENWKAIVQEAKEEH